MADSQLGELDQLRASLEQNAAATKAAVEEAERLGESLSEENDARVAAEQELTAARERLETLEPEHAKASAKVAGVILGSNIQKP